jgi:RNA polymerase sigma factor (sigma-70 family)
VQTALFKAAKAWHRIEGDPEAYVRRILYTQNVSWWRSRRHVSERSWESYDDRPTPGEDHELRLSLDQALALLTDKQRTVLVLRYYEDLTEVQTARLLGIGVGTVKSQTRQALARLRVVAPHLGQLIGSEVRP